MARSAAGMTWPTELRRERKNPKKSFGNTEIAGLTIEEEREGGRAAAASAIAPVDGRTESVLRVRVCHISTKNRRRRRRQQQQPIIKEELFPPPFALGKVNSAQYHHGRKVQRDQGESCLRLGSVMPGLRESG